MPRELRATRYLTPENRGLAKFIVEDLPYLDYPGTLAFYANAPGTMLKTREDVALLGCNDRYFLLTGLLRRIDALHPWLFDRCREVENDPDGHIDLWARFHYKSTIITFAGIIQEVLSDPEITIGIFSVVKPVGQTFLGQIKEEFENNEALVGIYSDVLYQSPRTKGPDGRPAKWGVARGITVKRKTNPKEATIEAHGLIDGQPVGRHFAMHVYDDVVTQDYLSEEQIQKTTERWEMADNLGSHLGVRKWVAGTRYHFADTYQTIMDRKSLKPRVYPATEDGSLNGKPVFLSDQRWTQLKNDQRSTVSAQLLLNPIAGNEATFKAEWFKTYDVIPAIMNVYVICDPSKGTTDRSDRTAIAVVGIDPAGNKYLLDGYRHRMSLSDRYTFIKQLERKWTLHPGVQMVKVGYEQYGMQSDIEVIKEKQEHDNRYFEIHEVATPSRGSHAKDDRIERLEPDIRGAKFYLPGVVWNPDFGGSGTYDGMAYWKPWTPDDAKRAEAEGKEVPYQIGQIIYRPMLGLTGAQRLCEVRFQTHRIVKPIKRRDENSDVYDVTCAFIDEARRHPYASHDDLVDAVSRIYDMDPQKPVQVDVQSTEPIGDDESAHALNS